MPAGATAVIRDICFTPDASTLTTMLCNINGVAIVAGLQGSVQYVTQHLELRAVLNAGDVIQVQSVVGGFEYVISGYLLRE